MPQSLWEEESSIDGTFTNDKNILTSHQQSMKIYEVNNDFKCENQEVKVTFGNSDLHEGCRSYIASTISHVHQNIVLLGLKGNLKNYPHINYMEGVSTYTKMSYALRRYNDHSKELLPSWTKNNHKTFKNDKIVQNIDAFICTFPASMCQMWMAFEKAKIVFLPAHRYELYIMYEIPYLIT